MLRPLDRHRVEGTTTTPRAASPSRVPADGASARTLTERSSCIERAYAHSAQNAPNATAASTNNAHTIVACVAIARMPSPPTTTSSVRKTSASTLRRSIAGRHARFRAGSAQHAVRSTEDIESVIEITDRVVCPLRTGSQHGRYQNDCPQCSENDQDHECQDLSTTFVVDNGNNGCPTSGGSPAIQSLQSLRDEHPTTNSQVRASQKALARINAKCPLRTDNREVRFQESRCDSRARIGTEIPAHQSSDAGIRARQIGTCVRYPDDLRDQTDRDRFRRIGGGTSPNARPSSPTGRDHRWSSSGRSTCTCRRW